MVKRSDLLSAGCVSVTWRRRNEPNPGTSSCSKAEHPVDQTDFAPQPWPGQDAVTTTYHTHDVKTFEGGAGCFDPPEAEGRSDHAAERAMIGLDDVVQVFRGSAHHLMRQVAFALQVL